MSFPWHCLPQFQEIGNQNSWHAIEFRSSQMQPMNFKRHVLMHSKSKRSNIMLVLSVRSWIKYGLADVGRYSLFFSLNHTPMQSFAKNHSHAQKLQNMHTELRDGATLSFKFAWRMESWPARIDSPVWPRFRSNTDASQHCFLFLFGCLGTFNYCVSTNKVVHTQRYPAAAHRINHTYFLPWTHILLSSFLITFGLVYGQRAFVYSWVKRSRIRKRSVGFDFGMVCTQNWFWAILQNCSLDWPRSASRRMKNNSPSPDHVRWI